jgi:hypothetical protein
MPHSATRIAAVFVLVVCGAEVGAGVEQAAPCYRFKLGEKLAYVAEVTTRIETRVGGQSNAAQMSQLIDLTWEVASVGGDGRATITQTVKRVRFKGVTSRRTVEYDTSSGAAPEDPQARGIATRLDAVVGARISATIDERGHVGEIRLIERQGGGAAARGEFEGLGNPSSEAGFRRLMGQLLPSLPEAAPAPHQSWTVRTEEALAEGKATTERRYTYEGSEDRGGRPAHKLAVAVTRTTENKQGEVLGTTNGTGAAYLDAMAGRLIESSLTHVRELDVAAEGGTLTRKVTETITLRPATDAN